MKHCDNCCFSTFAAGRHRPTLICRQKQGSEGKWHLCNLTDSCANFYRSKPPFRPPPSARLIPLTRGRFAIVDADDYTYLSKFQWFAEGTGNAFYAARKHKGKSIKMHRLITNAPDHLVVDHINHDGLNNTKVNLRICTFAQNCRNQRRLKHKTSRYKGVHFHKKLKKFQSAIHHNKKLYHLGSFKNEIDAAKAYDKKAKELHGQFAFLNFPNDTKLSS